MGKLLREPVFHFAVFGVLLFVWFALVDDTDPVATPSDEIVISQTGLRQMIGQFNAVWRRNPSQQELSDLVQAAVREEVMVREALALGLDRGDAAIRNRLRQKMQFLTDSAAQMLDPQDEVLRSFMQDNPDSYTTPQRIAFDQVYLGEDISPGDVADLLAQLAGGAEPQSLGRGGLLPASMPLSTHRQTLSTFGPGFFKALKEVAPGEWVGPVRSGYGLHLVRVGGVRPAELAEFGAVRDKVLFDWQRVQSKALAENRYAVMRARYVVVAPDAAALGKALAE